MSCGHSQCPFFELHAGTGESSEAETQCIVSDAIQKVTFKKGEILFTQGQPSTRLYALSEGLVKLSTHSPDGHEQILGLSGPGKMLVGLEAINDERHVYTAEALMPVQACEISDRALLKYAEENSDVAMRLVDAMNAQLAHSRALVEVIGHKFAAAKIASFIMLMTPKSRHGECCFGGPCSRTDMASLLGLSEETVCRLMAEMQRAGAIRAPRGTLKVRDWNKLEAIAEGQHSGVEVVH